MWIEISKTAVRKFATIKVHFHENSIDRHKHYSDKLSNTWSGENLSCMTSYFSKSSSPHT